LDRAEYLPSPGPIQSLGIDVLPETAAGLRLRLLRRASNEPVDPDAAPKKGEKPPQVNEIRADTLPIYLTGPRADMVALYEQLFANTVRVTLRYADRHGDPVFIRCPPGLFEQIGFDRDEQLYPEDDRVFRGFAMLREFYTLPEKFLGFRLSGLRQLLMQIPAPAFDILVEFDTAQPRLGPLIAPEHFRLFAAPAINLFEERCSRVRPDPKHSEHLVHPDSSPAVNYEVHRIVDVKAHYTGVRDKVPVFPLYSLPDGDMKPQDALYFTTRQRPRRLTEKERRFGLGGDYIGTETYLSLFEPIPESEEERVQRLQVVALCSNRHLVPQLPIGQSEVDFRLTDDVTVALRCIAGPTQPRDSIAELDRNDPRTGYHGEVLWRLINLLSFNHLGLKDRHGNDPAGGLREILSLFSDLGDSVTERQIRGISGISSRPITRSLRRDDGYHAARGTEIKLTLDERAFEGSGIVLLGTVLDRFFADYTHINSFTETVLVSEQRGEVIRFAPRSGTGPLL
ncbi:MAG: type VI secretion system baseplate subunit TssF, partial [Pseudomonadota bacterium]